MNAAFELVPTDQPQPFPLALYDTDAELELRYDCCLSKTGNEVAAAILTLATVIHAGQRAGGEAAAMSVQQAGNRVEASLPTAEYLTVKQAAAKYNLGERTVYRMVEQGLPVVRAGKSIRIKPRELEKRLADSETILR
jgi:excisionase family DNA binding protein